MVSCEHEMRDSKKAIWH